MHPNECVAVELVDGRVYVNAREQHGSDPATRTIAYSSDGGETFDAPFVAGTADLVARGAEFADSVFGDRSRETHRNLLVYAAPVIRNSGVI